MTHIRVTLLSALLTTASGATVADDNNPIYLNAAMGTTSYDSNADNTFGLKAQAGYDLSTVAAFKALPERLKISAEGSYTIYGKESKDLPGNSELSTTLHGIGVGARLGYQLTSNTTVYGISGMELMRSEAKLEVNGKEVSSAKSDIKNNIYFGAGAQYVLDNFKGSDVAIAAEYKLVDNISFLSAGISFGY
ncbi:outer membrane beta-barrel protein [Bacterioplanoides sp.]|uniref:outer membrane beta-barrel protein n=1 Tax=Bacterioplanoides sp. TaxID=2066072 RepID=UPI003B5CE050